MTDISYDLRGSLETGFIDRDYLSNIEFQPELLVNQKRPPKKVLTNILHELNNCDEFWISVAFVTTSGVASILNALLEAEARNVKGSILVSQYLNFTQPEALRRLLKFKNIQLRIATEGNSHTKGYLFRSKNHFNLIIGSSNLTAQALSTNKEWNIKVSALKKSAIVQKVIKEFNQDFKQATIVDDAFIRNYNEIHEKQKLHNREKKLDAVQAKLSPKPNSMQQTALENLRALRERKQTKALIISATGTGKTFLSAFDAKAFAPKRLLFIVHRLTIAQDALETFRLVFGSERSMGVYSGNRRELDRDFIFSTVQTISKTQNLLDFKQDHFDYIIVDESHRSGAKSYLRFLDHFTPKFLLGMTATPERTDGEDIFQLFDHNIAYEIRLNRAMEEDMLASFHYYGVTDLSVNDEVIEDKSDFRFLVSSERVKHIIEKAKFYGSDTGITRGLIFCSRKEEAKTLSEVFNQNGLKSTALTGDSTEAERTRAIENLESDDLSQKLDYIFTVDIFNEGIDIPKVNQIIMLRPTESAIIFIQQLGRGLRKVENKSYLTVIDFIGNYANNYLIPIALYGDTSYNKDSLRKLLKEGSRMIPGASTINFDKITKERIFRSIDSSNMQLFADLKRDYNLLKYKLGRTPMMMDFIHHGSRDPYLFADYAGSYYSFVQKVEKTLENKLTERESKVLSFFSKEINNSKRVEECLILRELLANSSFSISDLKKLINTQYGYALTDETIKSVVANLNFEFIREKNNKQLRSLTEIYNLNILEIDNGLFKTSQEFRSLLRNPQFKQYLKDSTDYSIHQYDQSFESTKWRNGFVLYRKYSRKDVFRILNFKENPVAQNVGGSLVSPDNKHCPIFVNYHKEDHISESTKYEDKFVNNQEFEWMSKSNRTLNSKDVKAILGQFGKIRLPLFIKKSNDEGLDFYYMGDVVPDKDFTIQTTIPNDKGKQLPIVKMRFKLSDPVNPNLYSYLHQSQDQDPKEEGNNEVIVLKTRIASDNPSDLKNPIPLYDFYAAAGSFSDLQSSKEFRFIEAKRQRSSNDYFACEVRGESMNKVIPDGSICLFKIYRGGSRTGKIVLVENSEIQDPDFNSAFTVKTYSSERRAQEDSWQHQKIILSPNSFDSKYTDIELDEELAANMRVIGEFVEVLYSQDDFTDM